MILDANETAFFTRELEYVKTRSYDTKYKNLKAIQLIPVSTEAGAGADKITYHSYTKTGLAKIIANYASDAPRVDVYGTENSVKVRRLGDSFGYDRDEIKKAMKAGLPLDQRRADSAKRAIDELINKLAWFGDSDYGMNGLINYPGITEYTVLAGASTTKTWATKTPDEIVKDVTGIVNAVIESTEGVEIPDTLLLPIAQYNHIASTRMTDGDSTTILTYILNNSPYLTRIDWVAELKAVGTSGTDRMMVYSRDPMKLTLELPMPYEQLPPEQEGYGFKVFTEAKCAGVIVYYPMSVAYADGI